MAKRYYWLKLPDGFFRQKAIKKLRKIAGGDTYTIIYLKMLLVAMKQDGRLVYCQKHTNTGRIFRNRCQNRTNGFSILKA